MTNSINILREITPATKMSEIVNCDISALLLLHHFGIGTGFGDSSIEEICRQYSVPPHLFTVMCKVYLIPNYHPEFQSLLPSDLRHISEYIHNSHIYYTQEILPDLDKKLEQLMGYYGNAHRAVLMKFYTDYRKEVDSHFAYEESTVLPYVRRLLEGEVSDGYTISAFEDNHDDIEEKLEDLKNIIVKYLPDTAPFKEINGVIMEIQRLGNDLAKHSQIENKILIPIVTKYEQSR